MNLITENLGTIAYHEAWDKQTKLFDHIIEKKRAGEGADNYLLICEHPHVYTIGKNGEDQNMLISDEQLKKIEATYFHIDRGGDITYHGPGQVVCYPLIDLDRYHLGLKDYIHVLEEAVIRVCKSYGIEAGRVKKATGVWLDIDTPRERKICAIGVRCSHFVSMHGLAFNVNTDLRYFSYINPCGFIDKGVTSLATELGHKLDMAEVKDKLEKELRVLLESRL